MRWRELGLHVDVVDDLRREDRAPAEDGSALGLLLSDVVAGVVVAITRRHGTGRLPFRGFELVVVVELLPHTNFWNSGGAPDIDPELALDELGVGVSPLARDAVDPERAHLAGDVDLPVVHRVAETVTDVAADDLAPALHHEAGHRACVAENDHGAALLVDPVPRPTWPLTTTSPPRMAAAVSEPALFSITTTPDIMFSHEDQPTRPAMRISGPSMSPQPK